ncbi:hypothetical protein N9U06_00285 [Gammaproteobacteria bacterium]|nr:hypothetical protein [Gammaproteobacteria bacterium]
MIGLREKSGAKRNKIYKARHDIKLPLIYYTGTPILTRVHAALMLYGLGQSYAKMMSLAGNRDQQTPIPRASRVLKSTRERLDQTIETQWLDPKGFIFSF